MTTTVTFRIHGETEKDEERFAKAIDDLVEKEFSKHPDTAYSVRHDAAWGASNRPVRHADNGDA